jgi:nicotinamide mononucleotide (NMN) deamidase PncC
MSPDGEIVLRVLLTEIPGSSDMLERGFVVHSD